MTTWDLEIRKGWAVGLSIAVVFLLLTTGFTLLAVTRPVTLLTFILGLAAIAALLCAAVLGYWLWGLINASYVMDRNAIVIHWGSNEHQIPMNAVRAVSAGAELQNVRLRRGLRWPGHFVGLGNAEGLESILFYATVPPAQQIIVQTETMAYALSPQDSEGFLAALLERLEMGATQEVEELSHHPAFLDWQIWRDTAALGLLAGSALTFLLLLGLLCWRYPFLPPRIAMQFTATGEPLLIADAARIFYLALIGLIFLLFNGGLGLFLYYRERMAAYFIWTGLLILQLGLWVAVIAILLLQ